MESILTAASSPTLSAGQSEMDDINTCFDFNVCCSDDEDSVEIISDAHLTSIQATLESAAGLLADESAAGLLAEATPESSVISVNVALGSKSSKKSKSKKVSKSTVPESDLDPAKHSISWFTDAMLEDYVETIFKEVLKPLAEKSPQLVYLMHTSNLVERAAGVYALVSGNKAHFHGANGSQYFRYKLGDLIICHGIHKTTMMIRERLLRLGPTPSMVNLASRDGKMQLRREIHENKPETKRARTLAKYGDHGVSAASKALDYSTEVADIVTNDQQLNPIIVPAAKVTVPELVDYLTKHVLVTSSTRKDICAGTINQGNADGPSTREWKQQKSQRGGMSASNIGDYLGILLVTQRAPKGFDSQILRNCRPPGAVTDADENHKSDCDKAIAAACKAGGLLLTTDNPLKAGHAWEPVAGAYHKIHLIGLAKEAFEASPDYDKKHWPQVLNSVHVQNCGLLIHKKLNFLCYSPDRSAYCVKEGKLIFAEFKLLFKYLGLSLDEIAEQFIESMQATPGPTKTLLRKFCLQPVYSTDADSTGTQCWLKDVNGHYKWRLNRNHAYFYQCLAGVNIGDRDCIDFVAITGSSTHGVFVERIYRSDFAVEWKKTEMLAEYYFCNQILQHLTKPLQDDNIRPAVVSFEQFTTEHANIGSNEALTWEKLIRYVTESRSVRS